MKRIFGIGLLTAAFLFTLCACGKSDTEPSASTQKPATSADVTDAEPEQMATLYLMTDGQEQGQYELGYSGELTAEQLLQGLTDLTGYHFDADRTETFDKTITVFWADTASFFPDTRTKAEATSELAFSDFDSQLQFMLDSTYTTLTKNLDVTDVRFVAADGAALDFTEQANWVLPADQPYGGTFSDYYLSQPTGDGSSSTPDQTATTGEDETGTTGESEKQDEFIFVDRRTNPGDPGDNLGPEEAAQLVFDSLVTNYEGETNPQDWVIALDEVTDVNGSEGYAFSVGQGTEEDFETYFHAAVTYDRNIYYMDNGASQYSSYT